MGRNGSGKSSLLWALQGSRARCTVGHASTSTASTRAEHSGCGRAHVARRPGAADRRRPALPRHRRRRVRPGRPRERRRPPAPAAALLDRIAPGIPDDAAPARPVRGPAARAGARHPAHRRPARPAARRAHPRPRLPGQGRADAASCEPRSTRACGRWSSTHDVEFVAESPTGWSCMAEGEVVADGPTADVVVSSPAFAPQVAKVLAPARGSPSTTSRARARRRSAGRDDAGPAPRAVAAALRPRSRWRVAAVASSPGCSRSAGRCSSRPTRASAHSTDAPLVFALLLPLLLAVVLARDQRGRPRRQGRRDARRALRRRRRAAAARRRHRRPRDGVLPARPRRAGLRAGLRLRARARPRCSRPP